MIIIIIIKGQVCEKEVIKLIDDINVIGLLSFIWLPWLIIEYKYSEYTAVNIFSVISKIIIDPEIRNDDIIAAISPIKFKLGGRPILIEIVSVHINEVAGEIVNRPFVSIIFRVLVFS